jgi:hypothetical protein
LSFVPVISPLSLVLIAILLVQIDGPAVPAEPPRQTAMF